MPLDCIFANPPKTTVCSLLYSWIGPANFFSRPLIAMQLRLLCISQHIAFRPRIGQKKLPAGWTAQQVRSAVLFLCSCAAQCQNCMQGPLFYPVPLVAFALIHNYKSGTLDVTALTFKRHTWYASCYLNSDVGTKLHQKFKIARLEQTSPTKKSRENSLSRLTITWKPEFMWFQISNVHKFSSPVI